MSYCNAWHEKIADRLEGGDHSAARELAEDDTGSSTRCEYVLANIVELLSDENTKYRTALEEIKNFAVSPRNC